MHTYNKITVNKEIDIDLKLKINTLVWMNSPSALTLDEAEERATSILQIILKDQPIYTQYQQQARAPLYMYTHQHQAPQATESGTVPLMSNNGGAHMFITQSPDPLHSQQQPHSYHHGHHHSMHAQQMPMMGPPPGVVHTNVSSRPCTSVRLP